MLRIVFNILLYIAMIVLYASFVCFFAGLNAVFTIKSAAKTCTRKGTATLLRVTDLVPRDAAQSFEIQFVCDGIPYHCLVPEDLVEGVSLKTSPGTEIPVWYDPNNPRCVIITEDRAMTKTVESMQRWWKRSLVRMLVSAALFAFALPRV